MLAFLATGLEALLANMSRAGKRMKSIIKAETIIIRVI